MSKGHATAWAQLPVSLNQLCLATVLRCGQSFRWKASGPDEWSCGFSDRIISLRQSPTHLHYRATFPSPPPKSAKDDTVEIVKDYFNLSIDLAALYEKWSLADPNFKKKAGEFKGVRMLRQDPWECLIGFICSSNNNISRIGQMVDKLCATYGTPLGTITHTSTTPLSSSSPSSENKTPPTEVAYYSFPTIEALTTPDVEETLKTLGFGYRAKYIYKTACMVHKDRPKGFLNTLRDEKEYKEAHAELIQFMGVGPKVADCVCLMSLDKMGAVPVDTHVWQIATRDYKFGKGKHRSLTPAVYEAVGDLFRELWGDAAGWAHSVLFTADLRTFSDRLENTKTTTITTVKSKTKVKVEVKEEEEEEDEDEKIELKDVKIEEVEEEEVKTIERRVRKRGANGEVKAEVVVKTEEVTERRTRRRRG
ncbi:8-oxoguanine glycosylase ogg1 [Orbilia oligospora]|uniref:N-glycosylase/DNA lyase n=1 Tax=Orbilia oligospora TaxID=2813651 RepID=A0A7C8K781_ORBOL|nr:8-oxoguanine glycosylase ogg1 [Orbilia oligospora]TGJ70326.1 8-oxoguanine glycosylase ogg1 [Orbilia oligospora]